MKIYKRTFMKLIGGIISAPITTVMLFAFGLFLLQFFDYAWLFYTSIVVSILVGVFILYQTIWGDKIRIEITESGKFTYYRRNKIISEYDLAKSQFGYHHKTTSGSTSKLALNIAQEGKEPASLDCEPLGDIQFYKMYEYMERFSTPEPQKIETIKIETSK